MKRYLSRSETPTGRGEYAEAGKGEWEKRRLHALFQQGADPGFELTYESLRGGVQVGKQKDSDAQAVGRRKRRVKKTVSNIGATYGLPTWKEESHPKGGKRNFIAVPAKGLWPGAVSNGGPDRRG